MMTLCRCGCGRQVDPGARRSRQLAWLDAFDGGSRAQHTVASDVVRGLEEFVRRWGCVAASDELGEWRDRADVTAPSRSRDSRDPEVRRRQMAEMEAAERRRQIGEIDSRERRRQLRAAGVDMDELVYVETTPPRSVAVVARDTAMLAADFAGVAAPQIRYFARASGPVAEERVVRRGSPVRGFVDRMQRPMTIWVNVDQGHDGLVEAVVHEVAHLRVGDVGRSEVAALRFVDDYNAMGPGWFDRRTR